MAAPRGGATRPTADRVREALFAILGNVGGARVLDLYAGTGALGIEALSRGAAFATFVEEARPTLAVLSENLNTLSLQGRSRVVATSVRAARRALQKHGPFDLVFADPPYAEVSRALDAVASLIKSEPPAIAAAARIVVEHAARDELSHPALERESTRRYGDTSVSFFAVS